MLDNACNLQIPESAPIGQRFCGNGDLLGFAVPQQVNRDLKPSAGPVITAFRRFPDEPPPGTPPNPDETRMYLQDGGFPDLFSWPRNLGDVMDTARFLAEYAWMYWQASVRPTTYKSIGTTQRLRYGWRPNIFRSLPLLGMGADTPDGCLTLDKERKKLECNWSTDNSSTLFTTLRTQMSFLAKRLRSGFVINPQSKRDRVITVHPLGGCPADTTAEKGVVDSYGRVRTVPGLWIADGSVMPGPIGANPSLTIAAFARRAACKLLEEGLGTPSAPEPFIPREWVPSSDRSATAP